MVLVCYGCVLICPIPGNRSSRMTNPFRTLSCRDGFVCFRFLLQAKISFSFRFIVLLPIRKGGTINRARTHTHTHVLRRLGSLFARIGEVRFEGPGVEAYNKARSRLMFSLCVTIFVPGFCTFSLSLLFSLSVFHSQIPC